MSCQYKGCPFPAETKCRHHQRLELASYSYPFYGRGSHISATARKKRATCGNGHFLKGGKKSCAVCRQLRDV